MTRLYLTILALTASLAVVEAAIVPEVRAAIAEDRFDAGEQLLATYRKAQGETPESIEALSWLGRGALARKRYAQAQKYAQESHRLSLEQLKRRKLDAESHLPLALGASIEVQAQALAGLGERDQAVEYLRKELATYHATSIRTRIQKNIHLLSLEGKPMPAIRADAYLGDAKPPSVASLRGKAVLVFFWAHWCGDCKGQGPVIAKLMREFGPKGLVVIGPTQHYGYVAGGEDAARQDETKYIDKVRREFYSDLAAMPVPLGEENFRSWGASTTPTLALVDRKGVVRMYHPGKMQEEELRPLVESALR